MDHKAKSSSLPVYMHMPSKGGYHFPPTIFESPISLLSLSPQKHRRKHLCMHWPPQLSSIASQVHARSGNWEQNVAVTILGMDYWRCKGGSGAPAAITSHMESILLRTFWTPETWMWTLTMRLPLPALWCIYSTMPSAARCSVLDVSTNIDYIWLGILGKDHYLFHECLNWTYT